MSLENQVVRVAQGTKDTLKALINKLGGNVNAELIDQYPELVDALDINADGAQYVIEQNAGLMQKFWRGTKDEFNAIAEKDAGTMYIITDDDGSTGGGDMDADVYDPQGKKQDIFAYVDNSIAAIPAPDVSGQIGEHNTSDQAHADIRESVSSLDGELSEIAENLHQEAKFEITASRGRIDYSVSAPEDARARLRLANVAYGAGTFVGFYDTFVLASADGANWVADPNNRLDPMELKKIKHINNWFYAFQGAAPSTLYSTDGVSWFWTPYDTGIDFADIAYGDGKYVVVGQDPDADLGNYAGIAYSTDGTTWTKATAPFSQTFRTVAYGNGAFVCLGDYYYSGYSSDGIGWEQTTMPNELGGWREVIYGNGKFVAIGPRNYVAISSDGRVWELCASPVTQLDSIAYGNGIFMATSQNGYVGYSFDGINWTQLSSSRFYDVSFGDGKFISGRTDENYVAVWDVVNIQAGNSYGFAYKGDVEAAVSDKVTKEYVDSAIAAIPAPDMTQYYTKEQVDAAIAAAIEAAFAGIATVEGGSF